MLEPSLLQNIKVALTNIQSDVYYYLKKAEQSLLVIYYIRKFTWVHIGFGYQTLTPTSVEDRIGVCVPDRLIWHKICMDMFAFQIQLRRV